MSLDLCQITQASNEFGIDMFNKINATENGNNIISPLSLSIALGMIHLGAKGQTNNELRQLLGYNKHNISDSNAHNAYKNLLKQMRKANKSQYVLNVANRVMVQNDYHILTNYRNLLQTNYEASIQEVDFNKNGQNAIKTVNKWVTDKTNGKIVSLIDKPLPANTKLVILNAVYFKGKWLYEFDPKKTKKGTFNNNGNTKTSVQMMFRSNTSYNFIASEELDADILELPYIGGDVSMYIILPRELNGLQKTTSSLTEKILNDAIKSKRKYNIKLYLPKFKIQVSYNLDDALKSLGVANIFNDSADLSGINGKTNLNVSSVVHKVFLEVNEEGSEAAAITALAISRCIPQTRDFRVDHPFICMIRHNKNDQNLFYCQITQL